MKENILAKSLDNFVIAGAYTRLLVHILLGRMELLNGKTNTYWRQYGPL